MPKNPSVGMKINTRPFNVLGVGPLFRSWGFGNLNFPSSCGLNFVYGDRCQVAEERLEAVDLDPIGSLFGEGLAFSGGGALCGSDDGGAGGLCLLLVIVVEEDRRQKLAHMPFHVMSQHAKQNVGADAIGYPTFLFRGVGISGGTTPPSFDRSIAFPIFIWLTSYSNCFPQSRQTT